MVDFSVNHTYTIRNQISQDAWAIVHRAIDIDLVQEVALKRFRIDDVPSEILISVKDRFIASVKNLAEFSHPSLAKIFSFGEQDDVLYLVYEYMPDGNLEQKLGGQPMQWQEAIEISLKVADALNYAYSCCGVIHRDLTPSNIFFTASARPMLSDFGLARLIRCDGATLTGDGIGLGTPGYMAPEEWTEKTTHLSSQYSLGVILYEMITGRKLFEAETPDAIRTRQLDQPLPGLRRYAVSLPESVEVFIQKALSKDPAGRFADMAAFIKAAENLLTVSTAQNANSQADPSVVQSSNAVAKPRIKQRSIWAVVFGGALWVILGFFVGILFRNAWGGGIAPSSTAKFPSPGFMAAVTVSPFDRPTIGITSTLASEITIEPSPVITSTPPVYIPITHDNARQVKQINQWDAGTNPSHLDFSPDGAYLISGSEKNGIRIWNMTDSSRFTTLVGQKAIFSPDGDVLAVINNSQLIVSAFPNMEKRWEKPIGEILLTSLAFSPNGDLLAVGGYDGIIRVFRTSDGEVVRKLGKFLSPVSGLTFSKNGSLVVGLGAEGKFMIWRMGDGMVARQITIANSNGLSVAISPNGEQLATGSADGYIRTYQASNGLVVYKVTDKSHSLYGLLYANDNDLLISGDYYNISFWRSKEGIPEDQRQLISLLIPAQILSLDISPDSRFLASGSDDGMIRIWAVSP